MKIDHMTDMMISMTLYSRNHYLCYVLREVQQPLFLKKFQGSFGHYCLLSVLSVGQAYKCYRNGLWLVCIGKWDPLHLG